MRVLEQEDVRDIDVDLTEGRCQESGTKVPNSLAQELGTVVERLSIEEEDEDEKVRYDEQRDASDDEKHMPADSGKLRDGPMAHGSW